MTASGKTTSFVYDAAGSRLIRRDPGGTTLYLDGQEIRVASAGGNPSATRYYQHGGKTVAMRQGAGQLTWLAGDHQGTSQVAVKSESQDVVQRLQLPFGGPRGAAGAFPGERGFVGGTTDANTGFTHLGAREYDPETGRFISVDPVLDLADAQQLNGYTYSNNSPVTRSDPSGLLSCPDGDCRNGKSGSRAPAKPSPPPPPQTSVANRVGAVGPTKYNPGLYKNLGLSRSDLQVWRGELSNYSVYKKSCDGQSILNPQCVQAKGQLDAGQKEVNRLAGLPPKKGPSPSFLEMSRAITRVQIEQEERFLRNTHLPGRDHGGITVSACAGADLFVGVGAAGEVCVARDHKGWGWSASAKRGVGQVVGYGAGFSLKVSEGTIEDLGGTGTWYSTEAGSATFEVARSSEGLLSVSAGPSFGRDIAVFGLGLEATAGEEWAVSGYFADMKLPDGMFEPVIGPGGQYIGPSLSAS